MAIILLNCFVAGQDPENDIFKVDIDNGKKFEHLKKRIMKHIEDDFPDIDDDELQLWMVDIDINDRRLTTANRSNVDVKKWFEGEIVHPKVKISEYYNTGSLRPDRNSIQIIIKVI